MAQLRAASEGGGFGAIAQLGERIVRNDEVGGSIPPGSTSPRSLLELRQVTLRSFLEGREKTVRIAQFGGIRQPR